MCAPRSLDRRGGLDLHVALGHVKQRRRVRATAAGAAGRGQGRAGHVVPLPASGMHSPSGPRYAGATHCRAAARPRWGLSVALPAKGSWVGEGGEVSDGRDGCACLLTLRERSSSDLAWRRGSVRHAGLLLRGGLTGVRVVVKGC